jgi:hypothetical protein
MAEMGLSNSRDSSTNDEKKTEKKNECEFVKMYNSA